jgi:hypothetical protein
MTAGALGLGLAGCGGCDCPTGAAAISRQTPLAEACTAVAALSTSMEPITAIKPTTTTEQLRKVRDDLERDVDKVTAVDKRGVVKEDLRTDLGRFRNEFRRSVDTFGTKNPTVGSAAPRINEQYQAVRGTVRALKANLDCTQAPT